MKSLSIACIIGLALLPACKKEATAAPTCNASAHPMELQVIAYQTIHDEPLLVRDATDRRYSIWTSDPAKAVAIMKELGVGDVRVDLRAGQILAAFLNDTITEDLVQIVHNKAALCTFADYADSGIRKRLRPPENGKKYTHATVVVFTPVDAPSHLGLRVMAQNGLSDGR